MHIGVDEDFEIVFESLSATDKSDTSSVDMIFKALIDEMIDSATSLEERNTVFEDLFVESFDDKNKTENELLKTESSCSGDAEAQDEGQVLKKEVSRKKEVVVALEACGDVSLDKNKKVPTERELEVGSFQLPMFEQHHQELELGVSYSSCVARWAEALAERREGGN